MSIVAWWRSGPARARLRRRLLVLSAPVALVLLVSVVKLWSVVIAGGASVTHFTKADADALRGDVTTLGVLNVIEPARYYFAAGTLAVLDDHLDDADRQFTQALARTAGEQSCPVRVNLEFVTETLGDRAAALFDGRAALDWYRRALTVVDDAPGGCFAGSTDPDRDRRALLDTAAARLAGKIEAASAAPPPPPPPPPPAPPASPTAPSGSHQTPPDTRLRLNPGAGDPLDRLQQILRDAAAARNGG